ncbi:MgtC/SapB family protein [Lentibacter algarum]|uniref:MgtC/SapB family protein n=1 Tax=Lentibacter algarum TaxID=576131 RepID=UPI001C065737|nr:MgtC/SapB family protein [Lentibacter algarum]MBU2982285.1 MgtC/SapB family protein [Lentibacter algarum]
MPIEIAALNLVVALFCGALVGSERQVRQRMAGLRTNALVALGAAGFVVFSTQFPDELSPTRVAAQVVSGIGFLGAGIIFRNGFTVHGLNTAATLWCSAAVGIMAGAGFLLHGLLLTALIVFVNLGLRPVVKWIKKKTGAASALHQDYRVCISTDDEKSLRKLVVSKFSATGFEIKSIESQNGAKGLSDLTIELTVEDRDDTLLKAAITPLLGDARVIGLRWEALDES